MTAPRLFLLLLVLIHSGIAAAADYVVDGRVTAAGTALPVPGATVALYQRRTSGPYLIVATTTGADGRYALAAACQATCFLQAAAPPFFTVEAPLSEPSGGAQQIDFVLQKPGSIGGQVDPVPPAAEAAVWLEACRYDEQYADYGDCYYMQASADGNYRLDGLRSGRYHVCAQVVGDSTLLPQCYNHYDAPALVGAQLYDDVLLADGGAVEGIDFPLTAGATISGTARDALTGAPVDVEIEVYDATSRLLQTYSSYDFYRTGGLAPGSYYLRATTTFGVQQGWRAGLLYGAGPCNDPCNVTQGRLVVLEPGQTLTGIDFAITPRAIVRGVVRDAATQQPLAGVLVKRLRLNGIDVPINVETRTAIDGSYRFYVKPGEPIRLYASGGSDYVGVVWPSLQCAHACETTGPSFSIAGEGDEAIRDFALVRGGAISGEVDSLSGDMPLLSLYSADSGQLIWRDLTHTYGAYATQQILPGTYYLTASDYGACQAYAGHPCAAGGTLAQATPIVVVAGQNTTAINFSLRPETIFRHDFELWP